MPPTANLLQFADLIDHVVDRFLSAVKTVPPLGKFESEVEALKLFILTIRNIESIVKLARIDLVLLPSANVLARAAFEIAVKAAWMVQPDDPFKREIRWLAHLKEEERMLERLAVKAAKFGGDPTHFKKQCAILQDFREGVARALPPGYCELPGNPSVEGMLESLDQKQIYSFYVLLSSYVHGAHAATWLYQKGLGTFKQGGEFISPGNWHMPLLAAWRNLQIFGKYLLLHLNAERSEFLTVGETLNVDQALHRLRQVDSPVK
jgi:hypothetical protein